MSQRIPFALRSRPYDPDTFKGALVQIVCFDCHGGPNEHTPDTGFCIRKRRSFMPYSLRLSYSADEGLR